MIFCSARMRNAIPRRTSLRRTAVSSEEFNDILLVYKDRYLNQYSRHVYPPLTVVDQVHTKGLFLRLESIF